ncbi:MAG: sterol desaturase family protein [Alphaproteobacteria bacterium]|nr:sterol desaturase family protein [Alphaproteobacteria bacterium]
MSPELIYAVVFRATLAVLEPFLAVLRSNSTFFWPYLLSFVALAAVVGAVQAGPLWRRPGRFLRALLPAKRIWWHPSARADYRYYVVNGILFPVLFAPLVVSSAWLAGATQAGLTALLGPVAEPLAVAPTFRLILSVAFFLAYDLGRYLAHGALHALPLLWEFHKVHHSAEVLTPLTNNRAHPVELIIMALGANVLVGLVTGVFLYAAGGQAAVYTVFGLHAAIFVYNLFGNLRHSHVWLSYGPLNRVFLSPAQHQIHHSTRREHFGKNRGYALALWDWLFGTLYLPRGREEFTMGLGDGSDARWHSVRQMYGLPFRLCWDRWIGRRRDGALAAGQGRIHRIGSE